ncbi:MAG TPA: matrixin family metalloprotease [Vicinamibacterales bacterium]|jgi:predicted Zn-dependent protease
MLRKFLLVLGLLVALPAFPAARLTYSVNGVAIPVAWPASAFPLPYEIDQRIVSLRPGFDETIGRAFSEWTNISDANVTTRPATVANITAGHDGVNSISLADDLFANQKFYAVTTNWYDDSGKMTEADIQIDTNTFNSNACDMQSLVAHEIGHFLGLDHSAVLSAVMYPYIGKSAMPSLDSDDRVAISTLYPKAIGGATLQGHVTGDSGGIFAAQVVAMNDRGQPVATALTDQNGDFEIDNVPAGAYRVYAEPLDGPVGVNNMSGVWRLAKVTSFPTQFADDGAVINVTAGHVYGNLFVNSSGTTQLNPKWIGAFTPASNGMTLTASPVVLKPGDTINIAVGGDGFTSGMTTFEIPNTLIHRVSDFTYGSNYVYATFTVSPAMLPSSVAILVKSGNETAALTGGIRIAGQEPHGRVARK